MKCQKCGKPAAVHLTEIVCETDGTKHPVEVHLCAGHAMEAGLMAPETPVPENTPNVTVAGSAEDGDAVPTAIVPAAPAPLGLAVTRTETVPADQCPVCGLTWAQFRKSGLMGCPHDYALFDAKLQPLLARAQEGATQHAGKVPVKMRQGEPVRQVVTLRLRRELQKALDAENYEQAALLRDQLKKLGSN